MEADLAAGRADLAAEDPKKLPVRHRLVRVARRRAAWAIHVVSSTVSRVDLISVVCTREAS